MNSNRYASASALDIVPSFPPPTKPRRAIHRQHRISNSFTLLGCNSGGGRDGVRWIYEEGNEDLADSRLGRVFETEGLDLVFVDVREGDATALDCFDTSRFLQTSDIPGRSR